MGEVGTSLYGLLDKVHTVKGIDYDESINFKPRVMHICFPYSDKFVELVKEYIDNYKPEVTVIHSTVPVGTTKKCGKNVFHSPVRGQHPNLEEGLKEFVKELGGDNDELGNFLEDYFREAEIPCFYYGYSAENTEFAKIMSTVYYGWCIVFQKGMKKLCEDRGLDFDLCYTKWNEDYNSGYEDLVHSHYIRPVLEDMPGKIGGHCIMNNCELDDNEFTKIIKTFNEAYD